MLGPGLFYAVIAMSISGWTGYGRIIRRITLSFQETEAHNMRCSEGHSTCAKEHPHDTSNKGNHRRYF
jgi:ABC-type dipeptide/oligopeptide/nickel transport system permease subunit